MLTVEAGKWIWGRKAHQLLGENIQVSLSRNPTGISMNCRNLTSKVKVFTAFATEPLTEAHSFFRVAIKKLGPAISIGFSFSCNAYL